MLNFLSCSYAKDREREYDFVEQPPEEFFCPVSFAVLLEPYQTQCCGNHLSQEAYQRLQGQPCPVCSVELCVCVYYVCTVEDGMCLRCVCCVCTVVHVNTRTHTYTHIVIRTYIHIHTPTHTAIAIGFSRRLFRWLGLDLLGGPRSIPPPPPPSHCTKESVNLLQAYDSSTSS